MIFSICQSIGSIPFSFKDLFVLLNGLDTRGVFLVKGALDYAAERLGVSKVTLYSDLDLLRRESESAGSAGSGRQKK